MKKDVRPQCRDRHALREQRIGLAAQMYDAGASPDQIAEILKVTRQSVYSYLTETGRFGGGYLGQDINGDGVQDWVPVNDPEVFAEADTKLREAVEKMAEQRTTELDDPKLHPACRKVLES